MRKQKRNILIGVGVVLLVVAFLILNNFNFPLAVGSGFQTLSLSNTYLKSNDPNLAGQLWILTVSQNGAGQSAYGSFKIEDSTGKSSNDFSIDLNLDKSYASYKIYNQGNKINTITWQSQVENPFSSSKGCDMKVWEGWYKPFGVTVYCYKKQPRAVLGTIGSPTINFQSTMTVKSTVGSDSCVITNTGSNSCTSKNGNVYASWAGSLVSGQATPSPSDRGIIALYDTSSSGWKTGKKAAYDSYNTYEISGLESCINAGGKDSCFTQYNTYSNNVLVGYPFTTEGGTTAVSSGTSTSGEIRLDLPVQIQFPVITMKIKASFIGINIPVGKPKITSLTTQTFQTGQTGIINVDVKNIGDGVGNFNVYASCNNEFTQNGNALTISGLDVGLSKTVYLPLSASVLSGLKSGTCTVTAKDINNPANLDSKTVTVTANAISLCVEGEVTVFGNLIQKCVNNKWITTESCAATQTAKLANGIPQCVSNEQIDERNLLEKIGGFFSNLFSGIFGFFDTIKIIASFLAFIFSILFGYEFLSGFKAMKNKALVWIFSLVIAAIVGYLVFTIFYLGLAIFVALVLIKVISGGVLHR